ncbi:hypothetical protein [Methylophaga sp.]|uniref:hypothetical protein n=1 Tax=Methylophaga sp. TaxID=2024840 RepID=UPI003F6A213B
MARSRKKHKRKASLRQKTKATDTAIISPFVDFLCVGGISILLMLGLLIYIFLNSEPGKTPESVNFGNVLLLQALINWPHFMASYRLLYLPRENIKKHPFSAIYVPAALITLVTVAILSGDETSNHLLPVNQDMAYIIWLGAAFYLAWHYTGQAWGMIATFSHLAGIQMEYRERLIIRTGLRVLLIWHVVWGAQDLPASWLGGLHSYLPDLLQVLNITAVIAFFAAIHTFWSVKKRTGKTITPQIIAPWLAIYLWYLVLYFEPGAYIFVQLSHALQYLIFPLRVELNRNGFYQFNRNVGKQIIWAGRYYIMLFIAGIVFFYLPGEMITADQSQPYSLAILIAAIISIHHYFVDGAIWKLKNPEVRKVLFSHIR